MVFAPESFSKQRKYEKLSKTFRVERSWARRLFSLAKTAGARYITLTTRHHDGFSLYDTRGLSCFDAPHSACGRDLVGEFVEACREGGIIPFFYHTLLDWHHEDYEQNFPRYLDYLQDSVEILCRNYGKIGGFWFDGMWDKPGEDWQEGRLYECIRQFQPEAMIINNTGLSQQGKVSHSEIDSVTFERGSPQKVDCSDKIRAGEMCQILNDHWGYAKDDCNYKSVRELIENFIDCRMAGCNFLINTGLRGNGSCNPPDRELLRQFGNWVRRNGASLYGARCAGIAAENAEILTDGKDLYAILRNVPMSADPNVTKTVTERQVVIFGEKEIRQGIWLDNGKTFAVQDNRFFAEPFPYGTSFSVRVAKLILK